MEDNAEDSAEEAMAASSFADLLATHKNQAKLGDARLARLVNEFANEPHLIHRSTIRNWITGSSKRAQNWRQVAAMAAVLHLSHSQTDRLLAAAQCPSVAQLRQSIKPQDEKYLSPWPPGADPQPGPGLIFGKQADEPTPSNPPAENQTRESSNAAVRPSTSAGNEAPVPKPSPEAKGDDITSSPRSSLARRALLIGAAAAAVVGGVFLATTNRNGDGETIEANQAAGPTATAGDSTSVPTSDQTSSTEQPSTGAPAEDPPPAANLVAPSDGATIGVNPVMSGTASDLTGISHVEMIIQQTDLGIYWNPIEQVWQERSERFIVPVAPEGGSEVTWSYKPELPLPAGLYRARVWARSTTGRGDAVGPLAEFTVTADPTPGLPGLDVATALQEDPVADEAGRAERADEPFPKVRVRLPEHGARVANSFRLKATAEYEPGVERLWLTLTRLETSEFWNFEEQRWQSLETSLVIAQPPEGGDHQAFEVDLWLPSGAAPPGDYRVTAYAEGSDGSSYEPGRINEFTVFG